MSTASAGAAAAAAAAAEQRRQHEEEEEMSPYSPLELGQEWEFKILRSASGAFKRPEYLRQCLDEEARAGWTLVEKFDDGRVRLKRPASARDRDGKVNIDPYRTYVGMSPNAQGLAVVAIALGIGLGILLTIVLLANLH
jgi:hypothetical protein